MSRRTGLWISGIVAGVLFVLLTALDLRMQRAGGWGIIDFELAGSKADSRDILFDWGQKGRDAARLSLWLDFLYLTAYGVFGWLVLSAVRDMCRARGWDKFARVATVLVPFPLAAAAFDAIEDVFLLLALGRHGGAVAPALGTVFAVLKFICIDVATAFAVVALVRRAFERWRLATAIALGVVALAAVGLVAFGIAERARTEPAEAADGRIVDLPGGDLHVVDEGPRGGDAIVLLPGFSGSTNWWAGPARLLARGHRVIRVDLLGHGRSEKPDRGYSMEAQGRRVIAALRELGVRRALVAGHSMGGSVAVAAADADPNLVRAVAVVDSSPEKRYGEGPGARRLATIPVIGPALLELSTDSTVRSGMESAFAEDVDVPDEFVEDTKRLTATAFIESLEGSRDYPDARPLPDRLASTGRPLLVIFGAQDNLVHRTAVRAWNRVPGTEAHVLPDTGHSPVYERPVATAALIGRFADRTLGGPR